MFRTFCFTRTIIAIVLHEFYIFVTTPGITHIVPMRFYILTMTTPGSIEHDEDAGVVSHEGVECVVSEVDNLRGLIRPGGLCGLLISLRLWIS